MPDEQYLTSSVNEAGLLFLLGMTPIGRMTDTRGRRFLVFPSTAKSEIQKYNRCRDLAQSQLDEKSENENAHVYPRTRQ